MIGNLIVAPMNGVHTQSVERKMIEQELIERAHDHTYLNASEVLSSKNCGCCYCQRIYPASDVTDKNLYTEPNNKGKTVICPHCGIDAVFGDACGIEPTPELLRAMYRHWFTKDGH